MAHFVKVAHTEELPEGELLAVEVDGRALVLARSGGAVYALDGICTHREALLAEGSLYEECLMCPVHGGEYDVRTGEAITAPALEPLRTHEVKVEGGAIWVARPEPETRPRDCAASPRVSRRTFADRRLRNGRGGRSRVWQRPPRRSLRRLDRNARGRGAAT